MNCIVLIIGGASGTGKSELAYEIARKYGISVLEFDDIHNAVKPFASPEDFPAIHDPEGHKWMELGVERNVNWLKDVSREMFGTLKRIVDRHIEDNVPIIIEGDFIHPELVATIVNSKVKALFVQETDIKQVIDNFLSREGGEPQDFRADISNKHGNWIAYVCRKKGTNLIDSRPWDTVLDRAVEMMEM